MEAMVQSGNRNSTAESLRKLAAENDPGVLNVHVVPHTHDDVGWRKTVDQYFHGWNNSIDDRGNVHDIISTAIEALTENSARTFVYAEIKFFSMWWDMHPELHDTVRFLIANDQWTFVNGGWCMHDEAASHYIGMVDQTTLGHDFLRRNLGVIPRTGWQLDPFGHSFTQASLLTAAAGMSALFFGRIDYQDLELRRNSSECEGLWEVGTARHAPEHIFWGLTGSYGGNYGSPDGFCFDALCPEAETLVGANSTRLAERIDDLLVKLSLQSNQTKGQHIMLTMGTDFTYKKASIDFSNIDVMIASTMNFQAWNVVAIPKIFGSRFHRVNIFYSNPDYYVKQKRQESVNWPVKLDDFFPYSDCPHCFWTGYFTSRSSFKRFERVASSLLLAARQIDSIYGYSDAKDSPLLPLEDALGVAQHHDAISGTGKQHVADDYSFRLSNGADAAMNHVLSIVKAHTNITFSDLACCPLLNETKCSISEAYSGESNEALVVIVYNSLAQSRPSVVRLPVSLPSGTPVCVQTKTANNSYATIPLDTGGSGSVLTFPIENIPPLGAVIATATKCSPSQSTSRAIQRRLFKDSVALSNGVVEATFDRSTGMLIELASNEVRVSTNQTWGYYVSYDSEFDSIDNSTQNSGAYIFRPSDQDLVPLTPKAGSARFVNTPVGIEVHASFTESWAKQVTRIVPDQGYAEIEYVVGPIPTGTDGRGKEIVSRLSTSIQSGDTFFTDSNGRQFMKRTRNFRPSWGLKVYEPVAGNYFPVNAAIYIQDNSTSLAVVVDRSQGGASLSSGSIELMVQRRTLADDGRGVDEPMNETVGGMTPYPPYAKAERRGDGVIVKGKHRILVGEGNAGASLARSEMDSTFAEPVVLVGRSTEDTRASVESFHTLWQNDILPKNVMLIAFSKLSSPPSTYMLRFAHQYDKNESGALSGPAEVDIALFFPGKEVSNVTETSLTGNIDFETAPRLRETSSNEQETKIELLPMELRTFLVKVAE